MNLSNEYQICNWSAERNQISLVVCGPVTLHILTQQCLKEKLHLFWNATKISTAELCKVYHTMITIIIIYSNYFIYHSYYSFSSLIIRDYFSCIVVVLFFLVS